MARKKNPPAPNGEIPNVDIDEVAAKVYPESVPKNDDGSPVETKELPVETVRGIGAMSLDSARKNKEMARVLDDKLHGKKEIRWGETDATLLFEQVRIGWSADRIHIFVQRADPQPPVNYDPIKMGDLKDAANFYDYVKRRIHGRAKEAKYRVFFREGGRERAQGELHMPDTTDDPTLPPKGADMPSNPYQFPFPPGAPPYASPYGYPPPHGYYPQPGYGAPPVVPVPPTAPAAPPPAQATPAAPPPSPPPPAAAPPSMPSGDVASALQQHMAWLQQQVANLQQQQVQPSSFPAPGTDLAQQAQLATLYQEITRLQGLIQQNQLQMERVLGHVEAQRQLQPSPPPWGPPAPHATPPQPPQPPGAPPGYPAPPMAPPPGYASPPIPPPGYTAPPGYGPGPQPPPAPPQAPPQHVGAPQWAWMQTPAGWQWVQIPAPPQHVGVGAPPPPQPQSSHPVHNPTPPAPPNPAEQMLQLATIVKTMSRALDDIRGATNAGATDDDDDAPSPAPSSSAMAPPPPPPPAPKEPFVTMPLGPDPNAPTYVFNEKDGSPNFTGLIMANLHKIPNWIGGIANAVEKVQKAGQHAQAQRYGQMLEEHNPARSLPVEEVVEPAPQPAVQQQQSPSPSPPPAPAQSSFIPSLDVLRG